LNVFFTQKNKDIYCIVPSYRSKLLLKDITVMPGSKAMLLGTNKSLQWKQQGKNITMDLSAIQPGNTSPSGIFVIKLKSRGKN